MSELLPCAHCGDEYPDVIDGQRSGLFYITCRTTYCMASVSFKKMQDCVEAWNRRAPSPEIARLRAICAAYAELLGKYRDVIESLSSWTHSWVSVPRNSYLDVKVREVLALPMPGDHNG